MVMEPGTMNGLRYDDFFSDHSSSVNSFKLEDSQYPQYPQSFSDHNSYVGGSPYIPSVSTPVSLSTSIPNPGSVSSTSHDGDSPEDSEIFSDIVLNYISRMLMEEDVDEKVNPLYREKSAIQAAEKPFYEILGEKYPPSPDRHPMYSWRSPDDSNSGHYGNGNSHSGSSSSGVVENSCGFDSVEYHHSRFQPLDYNSQSSFSSSSSGGNGREASEEERSFSMVRVPDLYSESQPAWQFRRGEEEARKFLPSGDMLVIDLEANSYGFSLPKEPKQESRLVEVKAEEEEREYSSHGPRGRKNTNREDLDLVEGRSNKQSAIFTEEIVRSEMFDMVLLCNKDKCEREKAFRQAMQNEVSKNSQNSQPKGSNSGKSRGKKQSKKEVVDLRTILIQCAQAVAADDRRTANELLKQIRQNSTPFGDGSQRLAHCFADGLEARLAGTGSQIYHSLVAKRTSATDILKAYQLYLAACPFKKISHFVSNQTILNIAENASRVHIIDFGIYFGFQWPCLIQRLSNRPGGPPKLRITGVDVPQPGFRPTERIEETGRRLSDYAQSFNVPFEYNAIASKWETIRVEDLKIDEDEVLIVNCLYRFRNLVDETVVVDSPRNTVLNTIRQANPDVFIHGIVNGSYSAPFFVTRFREALFHFSALFDMLETNVPREDAQRLLIERDLFGREALNVISCEGSERVERPETYKQWQVRNLRAGFVQSPLSSDIIKKARDKVKGSYHKDFVIDEDSRWLLQGWKGRIIYAISTWKPNRAL